MLSEDPVGTQAAAGMNQLEQVQEQDLRSKNYEVLVHMHCAFINAHALSFE